MNGSNEGAGSSTDLLHHLTVHRLDAIEEHTEQHTRKAEDTGTSCNTVCEDWMVVNSQTRWRKSAGRMNAQKGGLTMGVLDRNKD